MTGSRPEFPEDGILWREWNDETLRLIEERDRPVLLFVVDPDPAVAPFLKGILQAMPSNEKLRILLHDYFISFEFSSTFSNAAITSSNSPCPIFAWQTSV